MKNKTKKIIRITCAILVVVLIQAIGVTYAKYVAGEKGTGQAEIAKWAFEIVKDGEETKNVQLVSTVDKDTLMNGKIAPGTNGVITIVLDATGSEVDLDYTLKFTNEQNKPDNLIFTCGGKQYKTLSEIDTLQGTIEYDAENKTREIVVLWSWAYESGANIEAIAANDEVDTQNANSITEYTFDIVATATQSK